MLAIRKSTIADYLLELTGIGCLYPLYWSTLAASMQAEHGSTMRMTCRIINQLLLYAQAATKPSTPASANSHINNSLIKWINVFMSRANCPRVQPRLRCLRYLPKG